MTGGAEYAVYGGDWTSVDSLIVADFIQVPSALGRHGPG